MSGIRDESAKISIFLDAESQRRFKVTVSKNRNGPNADRYSNAGRVTIGNNQFRLAISVEIALHDIEVTRLTDVSISAPGAEDFTFLLD